MHRAILCSHNLDRAHAQTAPMQVIFVAATKADNPTRKVSEKEGRDWAASLVRGAGKIKWEGVHWALHMQEQEGRAGLS